jgi:hypothetical protein
MSKFRFVLLEDGEEVGGCEYDFEDESAVRRAINAALECQKVWMGISSERMNRRLEQLRKEAAEA